MACAKDREGTIRVSALLPYALLLVFIFANGWGRGLFLDFAFVGSLLVFFVERPPFAAVIATILAGTFVAGISTSAHIQAFSIEYVVASLGAASLVIGAVVRNKLTLSSYAAMLCLPTFSLMSFGAFVFLPSTRIPSLDLYLYTLDHSLGDPSFAVGRIFLSHHWLAETTGLVYGALPLACAVVFATIPAQERSRFGTTVILTGIVGFLLYRICPAAGPRYAFGNAFPLHAPKLSKGDIHAIIIPSVRLNAMPSLHVAWAILVVSFGWSTNWAQRIFLLIFLGLTILATLGTGEHYGADLLAAVPFALGISWLINTIRPFLISVWVDLLKPKFRPVS